MNRPPLVALAVGTTLLLLTTRPTFGQDAPQPPLRSATPADALKVPPGFKAELLQSASPEQGTWVSMAVDAKGRLYVSAQARQIPPQEPFEVDPVLRITLKPDGGGVERIEPVPLPVGGAMGMLWAFDSLYVSGVGPDGQAIYRLFDTDGDDRLDKLTLFKKVPDGWGEHGAHALVVGPRDNMLYIAHGNSTSLVEGVAPDSPHRNWAEDDLLPRVMDPVATFFDKLKAPYGYVLRTDPDGKRWELFAGGFRNQYDIDFNPDGELFTYDSDMEWDVGLPWYRPTRILHVTSGAEFGFREGTAKWPEYYPDSLGAAVDIGLGSPTGVKFGTRSNFPEPYKSTLFALDWTYGRVLAVHLKPAGATYVAGNPLPNPYYLERAASSPDVEEFMTGRGMPVSDLEFGADGAMYLIVGGRGLQSGLYRISYTGPAENVDRIAPDPATVALRALRHELEAFHGTADPRAVGVAWPHLGSTDRHVRYAARLAIEGQPVDRWMNRALDEKDPLAAMTALLALARVGGPETQRPLLQALARFPMDSLNEVLKLYKLRVIQLSFARQGRPSDDLVRLAVDKLGRQYPADSFALNRELSQLLVWLDAPDVVGKTLTLMEQAQDPAEQIWYALVLREAKQGTPEQRLAYFSWFNKAATFEGGNSLPKFVLAIRDRAMEKLTEDERARVAAAVKPAEAASPAARAPAQPAVVREVQQQWTMADLEPELPRASSGRDFARGREVFASLQCLACHRFANEGGGVGPDITAVANRFSRRDLLESIVEPSKVISEQYASYVIKTNRGETFAGQIVDENNDHLILVTDPLTDKREKIGAHRITARKLSPVSPMPAGLVDVLTKDEVLDLLAYVESAGDHEAPMFRAPTPAE
jgi:putative heme-binding domain-containing protein